MNPVLRAAQALNRVLGRRNMYYAAFTLAMFPLGNALESIGPHGPDAGGGGLGAFMLWMLVSIPFVLVNALLFVRDLLASKDGGRALQAFLACTLPFVAALIVMVD